MRVIELFGGIGAPRNSLNKIGVDFDVVDYVEIDKLAVRSYNSIYGTNYEPQDITEWNKDIEADIIFHGSPCQDFSIAGNQKGGNIGTGTRSSLMWHTVRIVKKIKPKFVIWENVRNVLSEKHKPTFDKYIDGMTNLGYNSYYEVLNSKDYGVPQNRSRLFVISILGKEKDYHFPDGKQLKVKLKDLLEDEVEDKYYISNGVCGQIKQLCSDDDYINNIKDSLLSTREGALRLKNKLGYLPSMFNVYNQSEIKHICPTITTQSSRSNCSGQVIIKENCRLRKLTPKECWRLMGFEDYQYENAKKTNSDSQLYKQAGNSIVVDVLVEILKNIF